MNKVIERKKAVDSRVLAVVQGDRAAAQELLIELLPRVGNLVRYLIGTDSDVEDITQRVLIELLRSLHTYRGESQLTTWTDRITIRTTLSYIKRRRVVSARKYDIAERSSSAQGNREEENPERSLVHREAVRVLDELPEEQRAAVVLHFVVGMSVPELAEELAIPFETVRSRLRLGLRKLRDRFGVTKDDL
ncbi:MAG: sigma-70 family RNA polymerase sigma factor [Deltaproteobacteria bacterium]|nr:sigma-70 family RNA polymerase sigma factor [Deltaproteobacteria bacterium]